eukprot:Em0015g411a
MKHVTAAAQKKTPYKCSVEPYDWFIHSCKSVSKQEMQLVSKVVHSMLDASKENCIRIPTGGTPLTLARVTAPKAPVSDLSVRTRKRRVQELQKTRKILSAGPMDSDILLQDEIRALTKEEKQLLLHDAGKQLCLFCLITLDQLGMSVDRRGSCVPCSLDSIILDHQSFIEAGGNLKRAKWYNNCIHDSFFNIPLSQTLKDLDNALIELEQLNQEAESVQQLQCNCCRCSHSNCGRAPELSGNYYKRVQVQPANVDTLCSCVLKATENVPELKLEAVAVHQKFHIILMQFSKCHVLYDSTVLTQDGIQHLGQAIKNFFCSFDRDFKGIARTLKMHILEDHMLEWLSMHQAGFGLMGEQGAESFHAKFLRTY